MVVLVAAAALAPAAARPAGAAARATPKPVPSLQPRATAKLWRQLVQRRHFAVASTACTPLRLAADKTNFRPDQPWRIRALGPAFHAVCEISYNGWSSWVSTTGASWYEAGVEARRRMAAQGFDVTAGDTWAVNEASSAVRLNTGNARKNLRDLVRGLYDAGGEGPAVKGVVYVIGAAAQSSTPLATYKGTLELWLRDSVFWSDLQSSVSDWSQESYGDVRNDAVAGASLGTRRDELNAWLQHPLALANAGPEEIATAQAFLRSAYSPLANAAWRYTQAFGWTDVPVEQMEDYVSAQTYAARSAGTHFGFAWSPKRPDTETATQFAAESGALVDRLAAAIHDSAETPEAACVGWCSSVLDGAWFNESWHDFDSWTTPSLAFADAPVSAVAGAVSGPLSVGLQLVGVTRSDIAPVTVTLGTSSPGGTFATTPDGPWTSTLDVTIPAGSINAAFYYRDTVAGSPTVSASASGRTARQDETVLPAALADLRVAPENATVAPGTTQQFTAAGADAFGNPVTPAPAWSVADGTPGTISASGLFTASATHGGRGAVTAAADGVVTTTPVVVGDPPRRGQTIALAEIATKRYGDPAFAVDATASSGLPVVLAAAGSCTITASLVSITGAGACTVTASQPGDGTYEPAGAIRTFEIAKAEQSIAFAPITDKRVADAEFAVTATASSGLPVGIEASGACSATGELIHLLAPGSCTVTASQPGDANYTAAAEVARSFTITPAPRPAPKTKCIVPKLIGTRLATAKRRIANGHCKLGATRRVTSTAKTKGIVLTQHPRAGRVLAASATITLVIGAGGRHRRP